MALWLPRKVRHLASYHLLACSDTPYDYDPTCVEAALISRFLKLAKWVCIHMAGNVHEVQTFALFAGMWVKPKIRMSELLNLPNLTHRV